MRLLATTIICLLIPLTAFAQDTVHDLGSKRALFVDHHWIDTMENLRLRLEAPREEDTALEFDEPWEGRYCGYVTVFKDDDRYRMYYRGLPKAKSDGSNLETTCYAESADGIHWEKPDLKLFEVGGTTDNNVILANNAPFSHNFAPFKDTRADVPDDERYKAIAGTSKTGLFAWASADGLRWRKLHDEPIITKGAFDSQNVAFWSEEEGLYACYLRTWNSGDFKGYRTVSRATSKDFHTWTSPVQMDFGDTPPEHLYTNQTVPYYRAPHVYFAIAARFMPGRRVVSVEEAEALGVEAQYSGDISDSVLLTSRGGNQYDRTFMEGYIKPGIGLENWTSRTNYPAHGIVPISDTHDAIYAQKNYGTPTAHLVRYSLRKDGFISVDAPYEGGFFSTPVFTFDGARLNINFATSAAGGIRVALLDAEGKPLPGFGIDDCVEQIGNEISRTVRWKDDPDLSAHAGTPVRLHVEMKDAQLFSFKFE
jgi:hypothetical protein